jgi:hypothetical protein
LGAGIGGGATVVVVVVVGTAVVAALVEVVSAAVFGFPVVDVVVAGDVVVGPVLVGLVSVRMMAAGGPDVTGVVVAVAIGWFCVSLARARSARAALTGEAEGQASTAATTLTTQTAPPRKRMWSGPRRKR